MKEITQQQIRSLFNYKEGNLYWKNVKPNRMVKNGDKAGSLNKITGYYTISINNKAHLTHRLIYLYHHEFLPKFLDHIDRNRSNNKIENLREVTLSQNNRNSKPSKNSLSEYKGVSWDKKINKWIAQIKYQNKNIGLGSFDNEIEAALTYNTKATELFKEYAYLNNIG